MMARRQRNIRTKYKDRIKIRTTNGRPEIRPFGLTSICAKLRTLCTMKLKRRLSESKVDSLKYARTNFIFPPRLPKSKPPNTFFPTGLLGPPRMGFARGSSFFLT
jgi:hypothetical protein